VIRSQWTPPDAGDDAHNGTPDTFPQSVVKIY
jgi:hypothetical protein